MKTAVAALYKRGKELQKAEKTYETIKMCIAQIPQAGVLIKEILLNKTSVGFIAKNKTSATELFTQRERIANVFRKHAFLRDKKIVIR